MSWTPESIAAEIRSTIEHFEKAPRIVHAAREAHLKAKTAYEKGKAQKRIDFLPGARGDRDDKATVDPWVVELAEALDVADAAHSHARDVSNFLEKKLSSLQSEARLIALEYNTGGKF